MNHECLVFESVVLQVLCRTVDNFRKEQGTDSARTSRGHDRKHPMEMIAEKPASKGTDSARTSRGLNGATNRRIFLPLIFKAEMKLSSSFDITWRTQRKVLFWSKQQYNKQETT
jgi:hypothetical protein